MQQTGKSKAHYAKWKKPESKGHILYNSFLWHYGKDKTISTETGHRLPGAGDEGGGWLQRSQPERIWGIME